MDPKQPVFELTEDKTPRRKKKQAAEQHRFLVRLLAPVNEKLRQKAMYRGDLSQMVTDALESVDLQAMQLVAMQWGQEDFRGVTIQVPVKLKDRLLAASRKRKMSMNSLINSALVHWLAEQGDVRIKKNSGAKS